MFDLNNKTSEIVIIQQQKNCVWEILSVSSFKNITFKKSEENEFSERDYGKLVGIVKEDKPTVLKTNTIKWWHNKGT